MQSKVSSLWSVVIVALAVLASSVAIIILLLNNNQPLQAPISISLLEPVQDIIVPEQAIAPYQQASSSLPLRLKIASLNIDALVEYVGLTSEGAMGVPKGPAEVAWFELGPRPGDKGSAVIDGHSGWKDEIPAVFDDLHKLRAGDKIEIEDEDGESITFVVRESKLYDPNADAADVFISNDGEAHLNLITCEGVWDTATKSRSKRLVVFADKE